MFAMFSLPFWAVGLALLSDSALGSLATEVIHIKHSDYTLSKLLWKYRISHQDGLISDLEDTPLVRSNGETANIVFVEHPRACYWWQIETGGSEVVTEEDSAA